MRKARQLRWRKEDGVSTVLPYGGGIHRVTNPSEEPAISVHLYGPRIGKADGRDYDPSRNHVCDRTSGQNAGEEREMGAATWGTDPPRRE